MWFPRIVLRGHVLCAIMGLAQASHAAGQTRGDVEPAGVNELVQAGALARSELEKNRAALEDEQDETILRRTLYGNLSVEDLTEQQGEEMVAAARRRFERQQARVGEAKKLVEAGATSRLSLTSVLEELDRARRTLDLAVSRARLIGELAEMVRAEVAALSEPRVAPLDAPVLAERYSGDGVFPLAALATIALAFEEEFARPLPVSARGATALHHSLGFDHRGRVDVALDPNQPEGVWLRTFLQRLRIPYSAFRSALPRRSTGPHIHIGPPSEPIRGGG